MFSVNIQPCDAHHVHLNYGDRFYIVEKPLKYKRHTENTTIFNDICPVCDDTHKINYRGFELDCPYCSGVKNTSNYISLYNYEVHEYIVNSITIAGSDVKKDYSVNSWKDPEIERIEAFTRFGNGFDGSRSITVSKMANNWDQILSEEFIRNNIGFESSRLFFHNKADADKLCKILHKVQKEQLEQFNNEHGTEHRYPY